MGRERKREREKKYKTRKSQRRPASAPDCVVYHKGKNGRKCSPPQLAPPQKAPISGSFSPSSSHTLLRFPRGPDSTAGLIKRRERLRDRKKKETREGKRGHTTGRHQLKPCWLSFFPFISRFMIEFLTNTLAEQRVQTHSKKLLFDSTSLRTL